MRRLSFIVLPITVISLSACSVLAPTSSPKPVGPLQPEEGEGYKKVSDFKFNIHDVQKTRNIVNLKSVGDAKILVVPVAAKDGKSWTNEMLSNAEKVFFGSEDETGWHSVSSYYLNSSYGKLSIFGEVAKPFTSSYTVEQLSQHKIDDASRPDDVIYAEFEKDEQYNELRKQYDTDEDGYIDSVVFMYSNDINVDTGYWAWASWGNSKASVSLPVVNSYMWVGYNFVIGNQQYGDRPYAAYGDKVDGHTVIHETGHLLGINDYYCYDKGDTSWDPSGTIEMHSNNIGDENIYSKLMMGWVNPYYVKTEAEKPVTLSLRSSSLYSDAIIINDTWNNSLCDEYLAIEYYTPNMLNNKDAISPYAGNGYQMYTVPGFRIYHIDARIAKVNARGGMEKYVDSLESTGFYAMAASNTPSFSRLPDERNDLFKECHLLEATGVNTFKKYQTHATNNTLFRKGSSLEALYAFFPYGEKFNDGGVVGYKLTIGDCNESYGTITISKI